MNVNILYNGCAVGSASNIILYFGMKVVKPLPHTYMSQLTLEDIAKQAGVSRSTVSRVVNDHPNVSDSVRRRVQEVIQNTGYHPNAAARTLASQRSWVIGLVLPHSVSWLFTDPYYPHLTQGIAQACNQNSYTLALFLVGDKEDEKKIFPRVSRNGLLDGVLVQAGHHGDTLLDRLVHADIPLVVAGRPFQTSGVSYIDIDNVDAAYKAVKHLIDIGYKRIATITGPAESAVGIDRKKGYELAMHDADIPMDPSLIIQGDFTETGGYSVMQTLLSEKPDAVFAASDIMAIGAMRAAMDAGLHIPQDIAFVGFDDIPLTTQSNIPLTTVHQPVIQFGIKAVELLIDMIENGIKPARRVIMETELVIRQSCGAKQKTSEQY